MTDAYDICAPNGGHSLTEIRENPYTANPDEVRWMADQLLASRAAAAELQRRLDAAAADLGRITQTTVTGIKRIEGAARKAAHGVSAMAADLAARGIHVGLGPPGEARCVTCKAPWPCPSSTQPQEDPHET